MLKILICTHDSMLVKGLKNPLRDAGWSVSVADNAAAAIRAVMEEPFDAVVLDSQVIGMSASEALPIIRHISPETKAVVVGEAGGGLDAWPVARERCFEELIRAIGVDVTAKERV